MSLPNIHVGASSPSARNFCAGMLAFILSQTGRSSASTLAATSIPEVAGLSEGHIAALLAASAVIDEAYAAEVAHMSAQPLFDLFQMIAVRHPEMQDVQLEVPDAVEMVDQTGTPCLPTLVISVDGRNYLLARRK
jgi:hypothetical protein